MNDQPLAEPRRDRRWLWCALVIVVGAAATLIRVPTRLGVKVPETAIRGIDPSLVDTSSSEQVWRVWWRARHEFIEVNHQWIVSAGLVILLAVFVIGTVAAIWIALSPEAETPDPAE